MKENAITDHPFRFTLDVVCEIVIVISLILYVKTIRKKLAQYILKEEIEMFSYIALIKKIITFFLLVMNLIALIYIISYIDDCPLYIIAIAAINVAIWLTILAIVNLEHEKFGFSTVEFRKFLFRLLFFTQLQSSVHSFNEDEAIIYDIYLLLMIANIAYCSFNLCNYTQEQTLEYQRLQIDRIFNKSKDFTRNKKKSKFKEESEAYKKATEAIKQRTSLQILSIPLITDDGMKDSIKFSEPFQMQENQNDISKNSFDQNPNFIENSKNITAIFGEVQQYTPYIIAQVQQNQEATIILISYTCEDQVKSTSIDYRDVMKWIKQAQNSCSSETQEKIQSLFSQGFKISFDGNLSTEETHTDYAQKLVNIIQSEKQLTIKFIQYLDKNQSNKSEDEDENENQNEEQKKPESYDLDYPSSDIQIKGIKFRKNKGSFNIIIKMPPPQNTIKCDFRIIMKKIQQNLTQHEEIFLQKKYTQINEFKVKMQQLLQIYFNPQTDSSFSQSKQ